MGAGGDDGSVYLINYLTDLWSTAGSDFQYLLHGMFFVTRIDSLGTVPGKEIIVVFQSAHFLHHRDTLIFGYTGIDCGLIDNDVSFGDDLAHGLTGTV